MSYFNSKAWMIRNDGELFPVTVHYYGNKDSDFVEETIYSSEWLYDATRNKSTKKNIIDFIAAYADENANEDDGDRIDTLYRLIASKKYKFLSPEFVKKHSKQILNSSGCNLYDYNALLTDELNQEFLRARFGGLYNTRGNSSEMYFRVSSTDYNWFPIIWTFVYDNRNKISTVTITRDDDTGNTKTEYLRGNGGMIYNQVDVDDFINQRGNPVIESLKSDKSIAYNLSEGLSIYDSFKNKNITRLLNLYDIEKNRYIFNNFV